MAPKASAKRGAPTSKVAPPAKSQKKIAAKKAEEAPKYCDPLLEGLVDTVQRADLPEDCKAMLKSLIPGSFSAPMEERHEFQTMVVRMIGDVTEQVHTDMTKLRDDASAVLEDTKARMGELEAALVEAENALATAAQVVKDKDASLQDAGKTADEKKALLENAKDAQMKGDAELVSMKEEKDAYASALTDHFKPLLSSDLEEPESANHFQILQPFVSKLGLDDSMIMALPTTCQKKQSERGAFDKVVMEQLEQGWQARITDLEAKLEGGSVAMAERAAAVETAEREVSDANVFKDKLAEELRIEEAKRNEAGELVETRRKALGEIHSEVETTTEARNEKANDLSHFESWNTHCFSQLKDKSAVVKECPIVQEIDDSTMPAASVEIAQAKEPSDSHMLAASAEIAQPKEMIVEEVNRTVVYQAGA